MSEFRTGWLEDWRARAGDRWWWPLAGVAVLAIGLGVWGLTRSSAGDEAAEQPTVSTPAESPSTAPSAPTGDPSTAPSAPPGDAPRAPSSGAAPPRAPSAARAVADAGPPPSPNVKLTFRTFPPRPSVVMWGSKRLGVIDRNKPLVVERPRDSGPVDVIVRSTGYVPVHTRAYTFTDSNIDVKLTLLEKKDTLYGYKEPIYDAGVPFPVEAPDMP